MGVKVSSFIIKKSTLCFNRNINVALLTFFVLVNCSIKLNFAWWITVNFAVKFAVNFIGNFYFGLVPKGLELMFEPTIGNNDQSFLGNWCSKMRWFSLSLMKEILQFSDKTIAENTSKINKTETSLKSIQTKSNSKPLRLTFKVMK